MSRLTIVEVEEQYHQLVAKGAYEEALTLITKEAHKFSEFSYHAEKIVYFWRFRMAALLNKAELVLQLLTEAVAAGHWYSELAEDEEFELIHNSPKFERLAAICEERRVEAMATAVPILKTMQPKNRTPPHPLLLALHGNNSAIGTFGEHWKTAVQHGWLVGLPQSSQTYRPGTVSWTDWEWSIQEIRQHFNALCADYPINHQQIVLAGFSMGGGLAASLALSGKIKTNGLLLVAPFLNDARSMLPYLEAGHYPSEMRAYIVASEKDEYCCNIARQLAEFLPQFNIPCRREIYPDVGHSFPPSFEAKLPEALAFLIQKQVAL
ncbi:MAG: alpha/beta hydrolase [Anaerolineales bacterium]|nr:alpha/beta hydrolase [Anaerolineales bacterium]